MLPKAYRENRKKKTDAQSQHLKFESQNALSCPWMIWPGRRSGHWHPPKRWAWAHAWKLSGWANRWEETAGCERVLVGLLVLEQAEHLESEAGSWTSAESQ